MKSLLSTITVVAAIAAVALLYVSAAIPMYIGEPEYYHVARVYLLDAAVICGFVAGFAAFVSAFVPTQTQPKDF